jgi:DNA polymerase-3 subunit delta'
MSLRPLFGHHPVRSRLIAAARQGRLPASLLLTGPRGIGKQRLALWLGQWLLCERAETDGLADPCGSCQACRYSAKGQHPDLTWVFPQLRDEVDTDREPDEVRDDARAAMAERIGSTGLWSAPDGRSGLFQDTMQGVVAWTARRPSMARRSVYVVGDAERMSAQASMGAANVFLKVLEEPPPAVTLILTSSEPGQLLPTILSRVVTVRVPPLPPTDVAAFFADPDVARQLPLSREEAIARAQGAPGRLIGDGESKSALAAAKVVLDAAMAPATPDGEATRVKVAARQGAAGARGPYRDMLEALTVLIHQQTRQLVGAGREVEARRCAMLIPVVEQAKEVVQRNIHPALLTASLLRSLHKTLHH